MAKNKGVVCGGGRGLIAARRSKALADWANPVNHLNLICNKKLLCMGRFMRSVVLSTQIRGKVQVFQPTGGMRTLYPLLRDW